MERSGVAIYFEDKRSGVKRRPELERLLSLVEPGDCVVVYKLDRLARSLSDLLQIERRLSTIGASLRSLTEPLETATPAGRMIFQMLGVLAEFERSVILERCAAGRTEALARGIKFGKPRTFDHEEALRLKNAGLSFRQVARELQVSRNAVVHAARRLRARQTDVSRAG